MRRVHLGKARTLGWQRPFGMAKTLLRIGTTAAANEYQVAFISHLKNSNYEWL